ncbi:CPBP family intramembrane glutamic endopeptidase [Gracilibacillus massiliensis]|uniref:CPBP family intramembrane glutamic endopeptidase n=1 Tax=Gracilibacillus massiliensis TaxID=1564956 RepID=UPI00071C842C|nr:type II CAAX endopeptidase family protein [Gracilibacillus massiliensis]
MYEEEVVHNEDQDTAEDNRKVGWGGVIGLFASYLVIVIVMGLMIGILAVILDRGTDGYYTNLFMQSHYMLILDAIGFVLALLLFKKVRQFLKTAFSFAPLKKVSTYLFLIAAFIINYISQFLVLNVLKWEDGTSQVDTFGLEGVSDHWFNILLLYVAFTVITPIKEEIMFRGLVHKFLDVKYHFWIGLIVSSVIFGALHPGHFLSAAIMGAIFVLLYRVTKSLVVPIILHILWNMYAITGMLAMIDLI